MTRLKHKHFDSTASYAAWCREQLTTTPIARTCVRQEAKKVLRGLDMLSTPDETNIDKAQNLLAKFNENIEVEQQQWAHSVAGYFPDIPAYLSGDPENMYTRTWIRSDQTPLRIWVGLGSSWMIDESMLEKRGVVLAAFSMAMVAKRPVIISPYVNAGLDKDGVMTSWDISTQPLVLAELLTSLTRPEVTRFLGLYTDSIVLPGFTGAWCPGYNVESICRSTLGANPSDLWLGSIHASDPLLKDPISWVKTQLAKYSEE